MIENNTSTDIFALVDMKYYAIGCVFLSVIGLAGNSLIISTIAKNSEMRDKSHLLVFSFALIDFLTCFGLLLTTFATFVGYDKNIPQRSCLWIQALAIYMSSVDNLMILLIGIDRVIILRKPLRYTQWSTRNYVAAMVAIALSFGLLMIVLAAQNSTEANVSLCILPSAMNGIAKQVWMTLNAIVCLAVLAVYVAAGSFVRKRKLEHSAASSISSDYRRLLSSLTIVAAIYIFSTMFPVLYLIVFKLIIPLEPLAFQQYAIYSAWTILIQLSCTPFIYYIRSREYRSAFRRTLCGKRKVTETVVLSTANNAATSAALEVRRPTLVVPSVLIAMEKRQSIINEAHRKLTGTDIRFMPSVKFKSNWVQIK